MTLRFRRGRSAAVHDNLSAVHEGEFVGRHHQRRSGDFLGTREPIGDATFDFAQTDTAACHTESGAFIMRPPGGRTRCRCAWDEGVDADVVVRIVLRRRLDHSDQTALGGAIGASLWIGGDRIRGRRHYDDSTAALDQMGISYLRARKLPRRSVLTTSSHSAAEYSCNGRSIVILHC